MTSVVLRSIIQCPSCGFKTTEKIPSKQTLDSWPCPACNTVLKPRVGEHCVFCSYGSVACPSGQEIQQVDR